jgi:hypothetical protein
MAIYRGFCGFRSDGCHNGRWWRRSVGIFQQAVNRLSDATDLRNNAASPAGDEKKQ